MPDRLQAARARVVYARSFTSPVCQRCPPLITKLFMSCLLSKSARKMIRIYDTAGEGLRVVGVESELPECA